MRKEEREKLRREDAAQRENASLPGGASGPEMGAAPGGFAEMQGSFGAAPEAQRAAGVMGHSLDAAGDAAGVPWEAIAAGGGVAGRGLPGGNGLGDGAGLPDGGLPRGAGMPAGAGMPDDVGLADGAPGAAVAVIGVEQVRKFNEILQRYKAGKVNFERRIIDNEQWWKLRHCDGRKNTSARDADKSAWLANVIMQKHADAMDAYPTCTCLPQEPGDREEAKKLSAVIPAILRQTEFEKIYSDCWWQKLKSGTGCYQVTWDAGKLGGLGDIAIGKVNLLNLFWEPGVEDIQDSGYVFHLALADKERLRERYPVLDQKALTGGALTVSEFIYDDAVRTDDKALVVDVYYKKLGRLHYCKYCGETVLFATENEADYRDGLYAHGEYPFVLDPLFPVEGSCCGYGYIDYGKTTQHYIDQLTGAIMENALASATPRWFVRQDGSINEAEYADFSNHFVHASGNLGEDSVRQIKPATMPGIYLNILDSRINEIKETLGNRDAATGGVTASVTSAAGIASLQEAAGKLSRDAEKAGYRVFERIVYLCIELIRQFYDVARSFRITGEAGEMAFTSYSNAGIAPQSQAFGGTLGMRTPRFDIDVQAQKENPYTKESYNELAVNLFSMGAFRPDMAEQTLMMLDLMDFKGKETLTQKVQQQSQMAQMLEQAMAILRGQAAASGMMGGQAAAGGTPDANGAAAAGGDVTTAEGGGEHPFVQTAKARSRSASQPR